MAIKLRTFSLEGISLDDSNHLKLIRKNQDDYHTKKYISKDLMRFVIPPTEDDFQLGATYVVKEEDDMIGFVGTKYMDNQGIVELWCNISKDKRNLNYGSRILAQVTLYMIEVVRGLEDVRLVIDKGNYASKHVALENGFILNNENSQHSEYLYFGNSK